MQTTVQTIKTGLTTSNRWPYWTTLLACGHGLPENHPLKGEWMSSPPPEALALVGQSFDCPQCDDEARRCEELIAFARTAEFSHLVERDLTAGKTGEWMSFLAYRRDANSPTGCMLAVSVAVTPRTRAQIEAAGLHYHLGPTRGRYANA